MQSVLLCNARKLSSVLGVISLWRCTQVQHMVKQVWWSRAATVCLHAALGAALYRRARETDLTSSAAITRCYMFIWKLFYAEYLVIPLLR